MSVHFLEDCSTLHMMGHFYRITVMESRFTPNGSFILATWLSSKQSLCTLPGCPRGQVQPHTQKELFAWIPLAVYMNCFLSVAFP